MDSVSYCHFTPTRRWGKESVLKSLAVFLPLIEYFIVLLHFAKLIPRFLLSSQDSVSRIYQMTCKNWSQIYLENARDKTLSGNKKEE